jgi:hypothetical protein
LQASPRENVRFGHLAGTKVSLETATVDQLDELRKTLRKRAASGAHKVRAARTRRSAQ